jgi:hypothetical protein
MAIDVNATARLPADYGATNDPRDPATATPADESRNAAGTSAASTGESTGASTGATAAAPSTDAAGANASRDQPISSDEYYANFTTTLGTAVNDKTYNVSPNAVNPSASIANLQGAQGTRETPGASAGNEMLLASTGHAQPVPASTRASTQADVNKFFSTTAPQACAVAAAWTVGPNVKIGGFETGTKVLIAGLANAESANKGDLLGALQKGTAFIAITPPGAKESRVATFNPATNGFEFGVGKSFPQLGGSVVPFANVRSGTAQDQLGVGSGNAGVLVEIPGSKVVANALANSISGVTRVAQAGELAGSLGAATPGVAAQEALRQVVSTALKEGKYYAGPAWRASGSVSQDKITLTGANNKVTLGLSDIANKGLARFTSDNKNYGVPEIAYGKNRVQLKQGTSYFQLSPVSGGRNHGDAALGALNTINDAGRKYNLLPSRVGNQITSDGQYVKLWQSVANGKEAEKLLGALKTQMPAQEWANFTKKLGADTVKLGVNFGQPALRFSPADTAKAASAGDRESAAFLRRDYNKTSEPQEVREILRRPQSGSQLRPIP